MNIRSLLENYTSKDPWKGLEFEGPDACLEESLMEYGVIWSTTPDAAGEVRFIYRTYTEPNRGVVHTDWVSIRPTVDFESEWNWVNWDEFCKSIGEDFDEWSCRPFGQKVFDLVVDYGYENVFGTCYHPVETPLKDEG